MWQEEQSSGSKDNSVDWASKPKFARINSLIHNSRRAILSLFGHQSLGGDWLMWYKSVIIPGAVWVIWYTEYYITQSSPGTTPVITPEEDVSYPANLVASLDGRLNYQEGSRFGRWEIGRRLRLFDGSPVVSDQSNWDGECKTSSTTVPCYWILRSTGGWHSCHHARVTLRLSSRLVRHSWHFSVFCHKTK